MSGSSWRWPAVYLSSASIVLLDEATCHLYPVAEALAEQAFATRPDALVVIAHRISSALRADRSWSWTATAAGHLPLYADLVGHRQGSARV